MRLIIGLLRPVGEPGAISAAAAGVLGEGLRQWRSWAHLMVVRADRSLKSNTADGCASVGLPARSRLLVAAATNLASAAASLPDMTTLRRLDEAIRRAEEAKAKVERATPAAEGPLARSLRDVLDGLTRLIDTLTEARAKTQTSMGPVHRSSRQAGEKQYLEQGAAAPLNRWAAEAEELQRILTDRRVLFSCGVAQGALEEVARTASEVQRYVGVVERLLSTTPRWTQAQKALSMCKDLLHLIEPLVPVAGSGTSRNALR